MPLALIFSSSVGANRIGGGAQALALAVRGIDPVLIPTVTFGASPARGGRGRATPPDEFAALVEDAQAQGCFSRAQAAITGHFSHPDQVALAAEAIGKVRAASPKALVVVDPVMGDEPKGLYVSEAVAEAVATRLVPLADWLTPNAWELSRLTGRAVSDGASGLAAAKALDARVLATSIPAGKDRIGLLLKGQDEAVLFSHGRSHTPPNGTGDLVTAVLAAGLIQALSDHDAALEAAQAAVDAVADAALWKACDLTIVPSADRPLRQAPVRVERLDGATA